MIFLKASLTPRTKKRLSVANHRKSSEPLTDLGTSLVEAIHEFGVSK